MARRRWRRRGERVFEFDLRDKVQAIMFGGRGTFLWAWAVWGAHRFKAEGVEFTLSSARANANAAIDTCLDREKVLSSVVAVNAGAKGGCPTTP
jgi:hypothetical protein